MKKIESFLELLGPIFIIALILKIFSNPTSVTWWLVLLIAITSEIYIYKKSKSKSKSN